MIEPGREEFNGGIPIALYRVIAPATLKLSRAAEPSQHATGEIVAMRGYPAAACAPITWESVYAKVHAIRRAAKQGLADDEVVLLAASLGAPSLPRDEAAFFINAWMLDPKPVVQP